MPRFSLNQLRCQLSYQLCQYHHYRRSRRQLLALDDRLLEDIGITRVQAQKEGHKPFWQHSSCKGRPNEEH
ncbi:MULTISPECIES: DUF1127 domain-containing protein [unclassified Halomonas]|uniref:DUF1127 domain-containing protein n=1 Tax=unclassified Halomonas TaxID=2609666 RepID=UPI0006D954CB|nr:MULTISPECIES: DUF1127 domain-containing protein [unclassified Halomonas]KPQ22556.1 MAG: DUF1127 domain protein of unknown function [Halomonas sp. HL-93]SBR45843.1 protein of unknown function (DUF1127) [Halomonas sp. HL-93]SNY98474.1 protein of unknown function [Halomonas sp. hl-4]